MIGLLHARADDRVSMGLAFYHYKPISHTVFPNLVKGSSSHDEPSQMLQLQNTYSQYLAALNK